MTPNQWIVEQPIGWPIIPVAKMLCVLDRCPRRLMKQSIHMPTNHGRLGISKGYVSVKLHGDAGEVARVQDLLPFRSKRGKRALATRCTGPPTGLRMAKCATGDASKFPHTPDGTARPTRGLTLPSWSRQRTCCQLKPPTGFRTVAQGVAVASKFPPAYSPARCLVHNRHWNWKLLQLVFDQKTIAPPQPPRAHGVRPHKRHPNRRLNRSLGNRCVNSSSMIWPSVVANWATV